MIEELNDVWRLSLHQAFKTVGTFLIKLGSTTIITDPYFSKNAGPAIFGPKRYVKPAITLNNVPEIDLLLLTHNHYDHLDYDTIKNFPFKDLKVLKGEVCEGLPGRPHTPLALYNRMWLKWGGWGALNSPREAMRSARREARRGEAGRSEARRGFVSPRGLGMCFVLSFY